MDYKSIEDDETSGLPKSLRHKRNQKIILDKRKMRMIEIADTPELWKECVFHSVYENLNMRRRSKKWEPRKLTIAARHRITNR